MSHSLELIDLSKWSSSNSMTNTPSPNPTFRTKTRSSCSSSYKPTKISARTSWCVLEKDPKAAKQRALEHLRNPKFSFAITMGKSFVEGDYRLVLYLEYSLYFVVGYHCSF